jgi:glucosamine--fructose-6-phosphate aminotransferase (isomerizing)
MCGIFGYIGNQQASPIVIEGLRRLEYRGYDSAGVAVMQDGKIAVRKRKGNIAEGLAALHKEDPVTGTVGIGHTRWATHGLPTDENSHPHLDPTGRIGIVHNGVIENYNNLRDKLSAQGHEFQSETDTEVLAHLIGQHYQKLEDAGHADKDADTHPLAQAIKNALKEVVGTYGIVVVSSEYPSVMIGARRGSPLIVGIGNDENFLASDANAIVNYTKRVIYLNDYDVVTLWDDNFRMETISEGTSAYQISEVEFDAEAAEKGDFDHFMLKEIFEQPQTVRNAIRGRMDYEEATAKFGGLNMTVAELRAVDKIVITACGTSWHAALVGEYLIEEMAHLPVEVEYASEFRYRNAPIDTNTLCIVMTQSGETADTLACLRESKRRGHKVLSICNVVGSTIAREADGGIYLHAGPEIGVASTKAFISQVCALNLFALMMGRIRMLSNRRGTQILKALEAVPDQIQSILDQNDKIKEIALKYKDCFNFFFLGRLYNFPVALEGALKLKEISYIHGEGYPAAEMKHGSIAMIDENTPTVFIIPSDGLYDKTYSNLEEIKARNGPTIAIATEGNTQIAGKVDDVIYVPETWESTFPLLAVIPLQLLSYHIAVARGCDVDKPRNLAKSVTVE